MHFNILKFDLTTSNHFPKFLLNNIFTFVMALEKKILNSKCKLDSPWSEIKKGHKVDIKNNLKFDVLKLVNRNRIETCFTWEKVRTTKIRTSKTKKNIENHANHHNVEKIY